jgi:CheY-like chemotaxis protein
MASLLSEMLELFDIDTEEAGDGAAALELLDSQDFSLVITDLKMPEMSGVELLETIKSKKPDLPVVVISGYNVLARDGKILNGLADGFINKPFKIADIQSLLERLI